MRLDRVPRAPRDAAKPKFYLDESVGVWVGDVLGRRHNVETAEQAGLLGRSDSEHFAHGWRRGKVIVTHDFDFYDHSKLPDSRNPGVIVLDCDSGNARGIEAILGLLSRLVDLIDDRGWRHTRIVVSPSGRVTVRRRNLNSGAEEFEYYRFVRAGYFVREVSGRSARR